MKKIHLSKSLQKGFTLIELLVSMAVLGIILVAITGIFASANQIGATVSNQTALQQELRIAGNLITDEVQRAIYVYPPCGIYAGSAAPTFKLNCAATDFPSTAATVDTTKMYVGYSKLDIFSSGLRGQKPSGTYDWKVGDTTAPILAMITAPRQPGLPCEKGGGDINQGSCYTFVAYFAVTRKQVTRGYLTNLATSSDLLDPNDANKDQWVLMEYRRNLDANILDYSSFSSIFGSVTVLGVGTQANNTLTKLDTGTLTIPIMRWRDAGCNLTNTVTAIYGTVAASSDQWCETLNGGAVSTTNPRLPAPTADPLLTIQNSTSGLPAIAKGTTDPNTLALFATRMNAITLWVEKNPNQGDAKILIENIDPTTGFNVEFPTGSIDERGVLQVRLKLQGSLITGGTGGKKNVFPPQPLEYFVSPRNISP
jgi:prepilin-type N-terminal cleavage/methylation domain-containing protein